ncbi:MAG: L,D-transpeptidase [Luteolibacter sp.]
MTSLRSITQFAAAAVTLLLASCANQKPGDQPTADGKPVNPHPPGTYDHFTAEPTYPKTLTAWKNEDVLSRTNAENSSIRISLKMQRGFLMNGEEVAIDYPISSGVPSRPTPPGTYYILEKIVDKSSNKYGKIYDASGSVVNSDADSTLHPIPEGGRFQGAPMRYWMRLTNDGIGHHIGPLPKSRRPASHACIRGPSATMPVVYSKVKPGTRVVVE